MLMCREMPTFAVIMKHFELMGFFTLILLMVLGLVYVSWHVWQLLPLPALWRWTAVGVLAAAFALLFVTLSRTVDSLPLGVASACYDIGCSSLIVMLYLALTFIVMDVGRLVRLVPKEWVADNWWTAGIIAAGIASLLVCGNIRYNNKHRAEVTIDTEKPTEEKLAGLKIVLASDLHLGYHNRRATIERWVEMINAEQPDMVLFAGDIIDMSHRPLREENLAKVLRGINAPMYACPGNHEYISGIDKAEAFCREARITLLRDSVVEDGGIYIIGRDDRMNRHRKPLSHLVENLDKSKFMLLLDHQPYHLEKAEKAGIDFQFSGHTHHGQVWPISLITEHIYENAFGASQRGDTYYYVSSGLGIWGGKYRIGTCSEYLVLTIL